MTQNRAVSRLGSSLRKARREARLSQAASPNVGRGSGCSVWRHEAGQGQLQLYVKFAGVLVREITGRFIPVGEHVGARLPALRTRMGLSRRRLAVSGKRQRDYAA